MTTVNLAGVELLRAGTFNASTGPVTFTKTDLIQMAMAAQDPTVDAAHIKLGHVDPRFDGEPSLGQVTNLRVSSDGERLIGDLVNIPEQLASIMPTAYPGRSIEASWGQLSPTGERRGAVLTGLALLGQTPPAVKGLADLYRIAASTGDTTGVTVEVRLEAASDTPTVPPAVTDPAEPGPASTTPEGTPMTVQTPAAPAATAPAPGANAPVVTPELDAEGNPITEPVTPETPAPVVAAASAGTVTLSEGQYAALTQGAQAGTAALAELNTNRRDGIIATALSEGRLAPADQAAWRTALDENEAGTVALLATLQPGLVPTAPTGHALSETGEDPRWAAFEDSLIGKDN